MVDDTFQNPCDRGQELSCRASMLLSPGHSLSVPGETGPCDCHNVKYSQDYVAFPYLENYVLCF